MPGNVVDFHPEASDEYDAAFDWYLTRSRDAALRFDAEVDRGLALIIQAPRRWAAGPYGTRRFLLRKFPFILVYREPTSDNVQVVSVAHTSRKPGYWKRRL
jgi:toxin ParE1/3/4